MEENHGVTKLVTSLILTPIFPMIGFLAGQKEIKRQIIKAERVSHEKYITP